MNTPIKLLLVSILTPSIGCAMPKAENTRWICKTHDNNQLEWVAKSKYQKMSINLAFDACKKQSKNPKSCKTSNQDCERFVNGLSTKPLWQCTALEKGAGAWKSNYYSSREDAAIAAKDYCKSKSSIPETCYVNIIGCTNANERI